MHLLLTRIVEGTDRVVNNNVAVGDTVAFEVTSKVPDMTGYKSYFFVVNDTMSKGLTFDSESVVIRIGDKNSEPLTKDADYELTSTVNEDKTTSIEIVFKNFIQYKDQKGADITISYNAELNENAIIGTEGNPNTANLIYNNDPNKTWDMEDEDKPKPNQPTGKTPDKTTRTFVTGIELTKVDPAGKRLVGAEFTIKGEALNKILVRKDVFKEAADGEYWKLTDGSYTTDDPNGENMDQDKYDDVEKKYKKEVVTEVQTVPAGEVSCSWRRWCCSF